jgi:hypothetical protein
VRERWKLDDREAIGAQKSDGVPSASWANKFLGTAKPKEETEGKAKAKKEEAKVGTRRRESS